MAAAVERLSTIGFCIGGRISLLQAVSGVGAAGVIGCYPWPVGPHRSGLPAPADEAPRFACPVLTIYGGADAAIGPEVRDTFARALADAGIEHESVTYEDAPHSFFDRRGRAARRCQRRCLASHPRVHRHSNELVRASGILDRVDRDVDVARPRSHLVPTASAAFDGVAASNSMPAGPWRTW